MSLCVKDKADYKNKAPKSLPGSSKLYFCKNSTKSADDDREIPPCICLPGVFTLEAAVIMPLLACFFVSILFFFKVMQVEVEVQKTLDDIGRKMSVYMAVGDEKWSQETGLAVAKALFIKEMKGRKNVERYVNGGFWVISLAASELEGDCIQLSASYRVTLPIRLLGVRGIRIIQQAKCRKWTGWHGGDHNGSEDSWVYVTETGTVYHTMESCTYLTLSIKSISFEKIKDLRNENGSIYHKCQLCAEQNENIGHVYITNQGDRYHIDLNCSGIKRTVFMIRLSEVGARGWCSKCKEIQSEGN